MYSGFRLTAAALAFLALWGTGRTWADDQAMSGTMSESELILQSSKLADLDVFNQNNQDDKLGKLENLLIDARTGTVMYGVLDTGVGGHLVVIPWTSLKLRKSPDSDKYWLLLDKTQDQLAGARAFAKDRLRDFADRQFRQNVDRSFGLRNVETGHAGLKSEDIFLSSRLSDLNAQHRGDTSKKLGNLDNLLINAHTGQVLYGILDTGLAGKNIAVPWTAFQLQKSGDDEFFLTLNKTSDDLANAPSFDEDRLANITDSKWQQSVDSFFGVRTAARPHEQQ